MLISNFIYKNRLQFAYTCYRRKITWWLFSLGLQSTLIFHYFSTPSIRHYLVHFIERGGYWGKKLSKIRDCLVFCFNSYHFCDIYPWEGRPWISSQIPPAIPSSLPPCKIGLNRQARPCLAQQSRETLLLVMPVPSFSRSKEWHWSSTCDKSWIPRARVRGSGFSREDLGGSRIERAWHYPVQTFKEVNYFAISYTHPLGMEASRGRYSGGA